MSLEDSEKEHSLAEQKAQITRRIADFVDLRNQITKDAEKEFNVLARIAEGEGPLSDDEQEAVFLLGQVVGENWRGRTAEDYLVANKIEASEHPRKLAKAIVRNATAAGRVGYSFDSIENFDPKLSDRLFTEHKILLKDLISIFSKSEKFTWERTYNDLLDKGGFVYEQYQTALDDGYIFQIFIDLSEDGRSETEADLLEFHENGELYGDGALPGSIKVNSVRTSLLPDGSVAESFEGIPELVELAKKLRGKYGPSES